MEKTYWCPIAATRLAAVRRLSACAGRARTRSARSPPEPTTGPTTQESSRFDKWKEKLLDLTFRNRLLSFKPDSRGSISLYLPDLAAFEDGLARGDSFELLASLADDARAHRSAAAMDPAAEEQVRAKRLEDLAKRRIQCSLDVEALWTRARALERAARLDIEEGGANTLYAALGFLQWFEADGALAGR